MKEWRPNPGQQEDALMRIEDEIGFGGARGGGKTDAGIIFMLGLLDHPGTRGLVIRKSLKDLSDWVSRAKTMYKRYGVEITGANYEPHIYFPKQDVTIVGGYLKDESSYEKYQGHEYPFMLIEELTQIPTEDMYIKLLGSNRTTKDGVKPQVFCTFNPGGVGHSWVKARFIDPAPPNTTMLYKFAFNNPLTGKKQIVSKSRVFIPSKIEDNPKLIEKDPGYIAYLEAIKLTNPDLYRAWRHGDWDIFTGQYFKEFKRDLHVVPHFEPLPSNPKIGSMDWGFKNAFVFLGSAVQEVLHFDRETEQTIKFNRVWTYKEIAGTERSPKQWAKEIDSRIELDDYEAIYPDPAMFHRQTDGSESIASQFSDVWLDNGYKMKVASNDRLSGWSRMRDWLSIAPDGLPYWLISESCVGLIKTIPAMVYDEHKGKEEDLDTTGQDHWVDAIRYQLVQTKWIGGATGLVSAKRKPKNVKPEFIDSMDLGKFSKAKPKRKRVLL